MSAASIVKRWMIGLPGRAERRPDPFRYLGLLLALVALMNSYACHFRHRQLEADPQKIFDAVEIERPAVLFVVRDRAVSDQRVVDWLAHSASSAWRQRIVLLGESGTLRFLDTRDPIRDAKANAVLQVSRSPSMDPGMFAAPAEGELLVAHAPVSRDTWIAAFRILQSEEPIDDQYRETFLARTRSALIDRAQQAAGAPSVAPAITLFDEVCTGCPSGEMYRRILTGRQEAVFLPDTYRSLLGELRESGNVTAIGFPRDEPPFNQLVTEARLLGIPLPIRFEAK